MSILKRLFGSKQPKEEATQTSQSPFTDMLITRAPPWNRVAPIVITTVLEAITDKGLLEAFVFHSMQAGLVARYVTLSQEDTNPEIIRAQISRILCETGNRAVPLLADALGRKQTDAATQTMMLAADMFEAAIALAKNQIAAYAGLATLYGMVGKRAKAQNYAKLGLSELEDMRRTPEGLALRKSSVFPPDIFEQVERQLRSYLA
jgi:hypothetical protein